MEHDKIIKIDLGQVLAARAPRLSRFIPRRLVRWLERLVCQDDLNRILEENAGKTGAEFCRGVLESLDVKVNVSHPERLPAKDCRRVVFVSNHPLGGLDGIALIDMIQSHYGGQVWFVVNDLLMAVKPLADVFLPINKLGKQSRQSLARIEEAFAGNDPIIIFPAGLVSRYRKVQCNGKEMKMVHDLPWQKMVVNKCIIHKRDVVPMFFSGTNSMDFYKKANLRERLGLRFNFEQVLLPREMISSRGKTFTVTVGHIKPYTEFGSGKDAAFHAMSLCSEVYRLSADSGRNEPAESMSGKEI